jgi:metallo-beta-lactamase class B
VVKSSIAGILLLSISGLYATEPTVSIYPVSDSLFVAEDSHYAKTNYAVYLGTASVTVVGAGWSPETAELLAREIKKLTNKPIGDVIVPDHDPEYAGGLRLLETHWCKYRFDEVDRTNTRKGVD